MRLRAKVSLSIILFSLAILALFSSKGLFQPIYRVSDMIREAGGCSEVPLVLNCSYPKTPSEVPRLEIVERSFSEEDVLAIAEEIFNFTGEVVPIYYDSGDVACYNVRDETHDLNVFVCGAMDYSEDYHVYSPPDLPSTSRAIEIAENLMDALREKGLMPRHPLVKIEFSCVGPCAGAENVSGEYYVTELCVKYRFKFGNFSVYGDSDVSVHIGDKGRVVMFSGHWREIEVNGTVKITVTPEQAFKSIPRDTLPIKTLNKIESVVINSIEIGYWADSCVLTKQMYLSPRYIFKGVALSEDGEKFEVMYTRPVTSEDTSFYNNSRNLGENREAVFVQLSENSIIFADAEHYCISDIRKLTFINQ